MLALYFAELKGTIEADDYKEFVDELKAIPEKMEECFKLEPEIKEIAKNYYDRDDFFFIGRGVDSSVAYE